MTFPTLVTVHRGHSLFWTSQFGTSLMQNFHHSIILLSPFNFCSLAQVRKILLTCAYIHMLLVTVGDLVKQNIVHRVFYFENWPDSLPCLWLPVCLLFQCVITALKLKLDSFSDVDPIWDVFPHMNEAWNRSDNIINIINFVTHIRFVKHTKSNFCFKGNMSKLATFIAQKVVTELELL